MSAAVSSLQFTPLHVKHVELNARMAPFAGFDMPISYDSVTGGMAKEHLIVRQSAGMFDVSHMGEFWVRGSDATWFLNHVCTRSFDSLAEGRAQYCLLLNESGGIVDDIIVYKFNSELFWVVVNASNIEKDFRHLQKYTQNFEVELENVSDQTGLIALQGPKALEIFSKLEKAAGDLKYYGFFKNSQSWIVSRTGYTGEDGFEIFLPSDQVFGLWQKLESLGVLPIGLGARDTLRLEVGFPLYGHELSEDLWPQETWAAFAVSKKHQYVGRQILEKQARWIPVALEASNPKPFRADETIFLDGKPVGRITSGSGSPLKRVGIALGLIESNAKSEVGSSFEVGTVGKTRPGRLISLPFVETARVKRRT